MTIEQNSSPRASPPHDLDPSPTHPSLPPPPPTPSGQAGPHDCSPTPPPPLLSPPLPSRPVNRRPPAVISALFAFFHFLAVFGIFAALVLQWQTMSPAPSLAEAKRIQASDRVYGLLAVVVLVVGFLRVYHFEKGKAFYAANPFFQAKLGCSWASG